MSEYISKLKTMNKKSKLIVLLVFLECIFSFLTYKAFQNGLEFHNKNEINKNQFNVKYEVDGSYVDWTGSTFPSSDDYELDLESSSCVSKSGSIVSDVLSYADSKVTVTSNKTLYCTLYFSEKSKIVLPEGLSIGDFVTYDAGTWTQEEIASIQVGPNSSLVSANNSLNAPTTQYQFGGFTVGTRRNSGAVEYSATNYKYAKMYDNGNSSNQVALSGWRIWDIDEENETITLVSAANPEDYYHGYSTNSEYISQYILTGTKNESWSEASTAESTYTKRDWSMYENDAYGASNARMLNATDLTNWYNKNFGTNITTLYPNTSTFRMIYKEQYLKYQNLIDNHTYYWLGVAYSSTSMRYVDPLGRDWIGDNSNVYGARILVSIPLESLVGSEDIGDRTVTLDGMKYGGGTYGTETTQTYNVWELNEVATPQIGDFVTYDAGTWTQEEIASIQVGPNSSLVSANNSLDAPTTQYQFGGFTVGTSRNSGAVEYNATTYMYAKMYDNGNSSNQVALSGWRIWDIDEENETITLVSAANPEDFYLLSLTNSAYISQYILTGTKHASWSEASTAESTYTKRDWSMYENETYGASNARMLTYYDLNNWYSKNMIENADTYHASTFRMIYTEPYIKYQNLIDNHTYYRIFAESSTTLYTVCPSSHDVGTGNKYALGARILVSIPLESLVGSEDIGDRTVTLDGMHHSGGTYGTETTQTYNVWELNEVDEPELDELVYYAFGDPTTSSPTTPPAGKNVYVGLYPGGEKAVCINRNGTQQCFKNNNVEVEQAHVQEVFSDISCDVLSSGVSCGASDFSCSVYSDGSVNCYDIGTNEYCYVISDGDANCS